MAVDLHARLSQPATYRREIERLHGKWLDTSKLHTREQDGVSFRTVVSDASKVARLLADAVGRGHYVLGPASLRTIRVNGKDRQVFACSLMDEIVGGAVAEILRDAVSGLLSSRLYSYRRGVPWLTPALDFAAYIRNHRRSRPNPKERGIHVLRRDIDAYTDSIPVGPSSRLWPMLREALAPAESGFDIRPCDWDIVVGVVRPDTRHENGAVSCPLVGVPTGQSIAPVLYNFYLTELDRELERVPGAFYARYSDDILFAHPSAETVQEADRRLESILAGLELRVKPAKSQNVYLTAAGRSSPEWREARGTSTIPYVGVAVSGDGTISLPRLKLRAMLRDIASRAIRTARLVPNGDRERVGPLVCAAINRAFGTDASPFRLRSARLVRGVLTDRAQLEQMDYWIARLVLRAVTGQTGVQAFRELPYRIMRQDWGLISLLHSRNQRGNVIVR